jgi:hypothetical protein
MIDVASRIDRRVPITSEGIGVYVDAVDAAFGPFVDYAMLVKSYGSASETHMGRCGPPICTGAKRVRVKGNPGVDHSSTSYV